jgi:hypothetical protein
MRFFHLEPLAIIFSLTYALLMWSCVLRSLSIRSTDSDDGFVQRLCVLYRSVTVLLPECDDEDSGLRGGYLRDGHHPRNLLHRKLVGPNSPKYRVGRTHGQLRTSKV